MPSSVIRHVAILLPSKNVQRVWFLRCVMEHDDADSAYQPSNTLAVDTLITGVVSLSASSSSSSNSSVHVQNIESTIVHISDNTSDPEPILIMKMNQLSRIAKMGQMSQFTMVSQLTNQMSLQMNHFIQMSQLTQTRALCRIVADRMKFLITGLQTQIMSVPMEKNLTSHGLTTGPATRHAMNP